MGGATGSRNGKVITNGVESQVADEVKGEEGDGNTAARVEDGRRTPGQGCIASAKAQAADRDEEVRREEQRRSITAPFEEAATAEVAEATGQTQGLSSVGRRRRNGSGAEAPPGFR